MGVGRTCGTEEYDGRAGQKCRRVFRDGGSGQWCGMEEQDRGVGYNGRDGAAGKMFRPDLQVGGVDWAVVPRCGTVVQQGDTEKMSGIVVRDGGERQLCRMVQTCETRRFS